MIIEVLVFGSIVCAMVYVLYDTYKFNKEWNKLMKEVEEDRLEMLAFIKEQKKSNE